MLLLLAVGRGEAQAPARDSSELSGTTDRAFPIFAPAVRSPVQAIVGREKTRFFYRDIDYGSASTITPIGVVFNRGFSVIQLGTTYPRDPRQYDWDVRIGGVVDALVNPGAAIRRFGGLERFLRYQVIPFSTRNTRTWAWATNYSGHLVAGGISYRHMAEWYEAHGTPHPRWAAALTYWGTQFINEVIEQRSPVGGASTVADLYLFDTPAILLFNIDPIARFFSETVRSVDWSPMASLTLPNGEVQNNGQHMVHKFPLPQLRRVEGFWRLGMGSQAGVSILTGNGYSFSPAMGIEARDRQTDAITQEERVELEASFGIYWDRFDSLLASITYVPNTKNVISINVYPGVLPGPARPLGMWLVKTSEGKIRFGVASRRSLGLGLGYGH